MKVLIVNPILYTSETHEVKKVKSIKDTMIYDLCLAFVQEGIDVTLAAASDFKPTDIEEYPFKIEWLNTKFKKIFFPNVIPYCPEIKRLVKNNEYDLIISSEVFSLNSLMLARRRYDKLIIWHELAKHNNILHKLPSKLWYGVIARLFFKKALIVARSAEAKAFISHYCKNVCDEIIDHGVNLEKFKAVSEKDNCFCVCSQLIARKQIDKTIKAFHSYINKYDRTALLYIIGEGEEEKKLKALCEELSLKKNIIFTGKLNHSELVSYLQKSKAMLVYTRKDNNMVSIVEAIAVATPIITTSVPYNAGYIEKNGLGIVNDTWGADELNSVASNTQFVSACMNYRETLSTNTRANAFLQIKQNYLNKI